MYKCNDCDNATQQPHCLICDKCFEKQSDLSMHSVNHSEFNNHSDILQLDGNLSVTETINPDCSQVANESLVHPSSIPVFISSRTSSEAPKCKRQCFNKVIRKDNKLLEALNLPAFTVYNMRSLWSKINNLAEDIIDRSVDISILSEVWEKKENLKHQASIEEMLELKGIIYISTPRPGAKSGDWWWFCNCCVSKEIFSCKTAH